MDAKARRKFARDAFKEQMAQAMGTDSVIGFEVHVNEHYDCPRMWGFKGIYLKEEMPKLHPSSCRNSMGCGCTWTSLIFEDDNTSSADELNKRRAKSQVSPVESQVQTKSDQGAESSCVDSGQDLSTISQERHGQQMTEACRSKSNGVQKTGNRPGYSSLLFMSIILMGVLAAFTLTYFKA